MVGLVLYGGASVVFCSRAHQIFKWSCGVSGLSVIQMWTAIKARVSGWTKFMDQEAGFWLWEKSRLIVDIRDIYPMYYQLRITFQANCAGNSIHTSKDMEYFSNEDVCLLVRCANFELENLHCSNNNKAYKVKHLSSKEMVNASSDYLVLKLRNFLILPQHFKQLPALGFIFSVNIAHNITNCNNIFMSD